MDKRKDSNLGQVILLNGTSSAGKTTIAKAIQTAAHEPYQIVALDQFRDGMPDRFRGLNSSVHTTGAEGLNVRAEIRDGLTLTHIEFGQHGAQVLKGMRRSISACAKSGLNVIVDDMITERDFAIDYVEVLHEFPTLCVGIHCDDEELLARERLRPGRFAGTAISHLERVHKYMQYDVEIDNTHGDPRDHAEFILSLTNSIGEEAAVQRMWSAFELDTRILETD